MQSETFKTTEKPHLHLVPSTSFEDMEVFESPDQWAQKNLKVLEVLYHQAVEKGEISNNYKANQKALDELSLLSERLAKDMEEVPLDERVPLIKACSTILGNGGDNDSEEIARKYVKYYMNIYADSREFLAGLKTRKYLIQLFRNKVAELLDAGLLRDYLKKIGWLEFDLNGLKGLNDRFSHHNGSDAIAYFHTFLNSCGTLNCSNESMSLDIGVQGGDEASGYLRMYDDDLGQKIPSILKSLFFEMSTWDASHITKMDHISEGDRESIRAKFLEEGVDLNDPKNKYIMSCSAGYSTLYEAISNKDLNFAESASFNEALDKIISLMVTAADIKASRTKITIKDRVSRQSKLMEVLFAARSEKVVDEESLEAAIPEITPQLVKYIKIYEKDSSPTRREKRKKVNQPLIT